MVARPLNKLTQKDAEWKWGTQQQHVFDTLKQCVTMEPILAQPDPNKQYILEVDALGFMVGAVLLQKGNDAKHHPISYYSSMLNDVEPNYNVYNCELHTMVKGLDNNRPLLVGTCIPIIIRKDCVNLKHWRELQKISQ